MERHATEKQINFIKKLIVEKDYEFDESNFDVITIKEASNLIQELLGRPSKIRNVEKPIASGVESGYYAVIEDGVLHFFKVDSPTEGKWAGYTFIRIQASNETYPIKNKERREKILDLIKADPREAMERYGQELGICGRCGRTLTDEESRARGIGPICAGLL